MNKKSILIAGTFVAGCVTSGLVGFTMGAYPLGKLLTSSGIPLESVPDIFNLIRKYQTLSQAAAYSAEKENTSPETMIKFFRLILEYVKDHPEIMNDPRFEEVAFDVEFDGIKKNFDKDEFSDRPPPPDPTDGVNH